MASAIDRAVAHEENPAVVDDVLAGLGVPADVLARSADVAPVVAGAKTPDSEVPAHVKAQGEKAVETWKTLKDERNQFKLDAETQKSRLEQAQLRLQELEKNTLASSEKQELESLRQRATELEDKIGKYDLTATKEFKNKYDAKLDTLYGKGIRMLMARQMPQEDAVKVMQEAFAHPDRRDAVLMDLPGSVQGAILSLVTDMDVIREDREAAVANWREQQALLQEEGSRATELQLAKDIVKETSDAISAVQSEGNWLYKTSESSSEWNDQVEQRRMMVQGILRNSSPTDLAKWVAEGVTARITRELYASTYDKLRSVTQELNSVIKRRPGLGGASGAPAARAAAGKAAPMSPERFLDQEFVPGR
jgi:DNA repair ATPase RecN